MQAVRGLPEFCRRHKIIIPSGDAFNLLEFLLEVGKKSIKLAEYKGSVTEAIARLGEESEAWGGCPRCGSNVHLGLKECPVCGLDLTEDEENETESSKSKDNKNKKAAPEEDDDDDLSDLDPTYGEEEAEEVDDLDELDSEDESEDGDEEGSDDVDTEENEDDPLDDSFEEDDESSEDEEGEASEEDDNDDEFESKKKKSKTDDEFQDDLDDEEEPFSAAQESIEQKKAAQRQQENSAKVNSRRNLMSHAEKVNVRESRRKKLESFIPKFRKKPELVDRLKYRDLLIMPGLLGYSSKPTAIGGKKTIQKWIKQALKKGASV